MAESAFRFGKVAIVGRPNVGKSTLLNHLVGVPLSITSSKAQTTRHRIQGILTDKDAQYVFVDTPGFQKRFQSKLNSMMNRAVTNALDEVDVVVMVIEARGWDERDAPVLALLPEGKPVILALNKVDRARDKAVLAKTLVQVAAMRDFAALVPVSAEKGTQLKPLLAEIRRFLPEAPAGYDADTLTDRSERFLAAELIREKIFRLLGDELPYTTAVAIENFAIEGTMRRIAATIYVDRPGQKAILIGEGGETLKRIGTEARKSMEALFGAKVFLELWVKPKSGWADSEALLRQWGYE
jgi:GTP-binding protein Era